MGGRRAHARRLVPRLKFQLDFGRDNTLTAVAARLPHMSFSPGQYLSPARPRISAAIVSARRPCVIRLMARAPGPRPLSSHQFVIPIVKEDNNSVLHAHLFVLCPIMAVIILAETDSNLKIVNVQFKWKCLGNIAFDHRREDFSILFVPINSMKM